MLLDLLAVGPHKVVEPVLLDPSKALRVCLVEAKPGVGRLNLAKIILCILHKLPIGVIAVTDHATIECN